MAAMKAGEQATESTIDAPPRVGQPTGSEPRRPRPARKPGVKRPPRPTPWQRRVRRAKRHARRAFVMFGDKSDADEVAEGPRVAKWESWTSWPLVGLAVLFTATYADQVLRRHPSAAWRHAVDTTTWVIYALFAIDFVVRVCLARRHLRYIWRHMVDIVIIGLPTLRPLRLLRVVLVVRTLNRKMSSTFGGRVVLYGAFIAVLLVFCSSLAVLQAERNVPGANIKGFGDALWWAVVTICTVGYGDTFPMSTEGRLIGVGLMLSGVGLFGAVTASFATWLVDQLRSDEEEAMERSQESSRTELDLMRAQLDRVESQLTALTEAMTRRRNP